MGFKLWFYFPRPDGEYKHFIDVCVKRLLVPAAQQWGIKKADASHVFFITAFVFLIAVKVAFKIFFYFFSKQQVLHRA